MPDENVIQKQETTEVLGLDGKTQNVNASPLADLFTKMEQAKADGGNASDAIKESQVIKEEKKTEVKELEQKKEVVTDLEKKLNEAQDKKDAAEEDKNDDPRAALRRATEEKKVAAKEEKKEVKEEVQKTEEDVPEDELQVLPHDKPKTAKRIQALLKKVDSINSEVAKTRAEAAEKATKLAELEKKLTEVKTVSPEMDQKVQEQIKELSMYRRRYELDKDPEVKTKFDARVESAEESIQTSLKKRGAGEGLLNIIKEEGGWAGFSESGRMVDIPDGEGGTKRVTAAELADVILKQLPLGERKNVEAAMLEQVQTKRDKQRYFKEQQDSANDYFKKKEEESQKGSAEQQKQVEEAKKTIDNWIKTVEAEEWLKDKDVPEKATAQEKAEIAEYNKYNRDLKSVIRMAVNTKDLNGLLDVVKDSALYHNERRTTSSLRRENERLKADLAAKSDEITKFRSASRSTTKPGSISTSSTPQTAAEKKPKSLEEAFAMKERGESWDE